MVQQAVLNGVRILSLEQVHVLPWGTAFLADFGAEVVRVESADHMNDRRSGPESPDDQTVVFPLNRQRSFTTQRGQSGTRALQV